MPFKEKLQKNLVEHFVFVLLAEFAERFFIAIAIGFGPLRPRLAVKMFLQRGKERVVRKPRGLFFVGEKFVFSPRVEKTRVRFLKKCIARCTDPIIVDDGGIDRLIAHRGGNFFAHEKSVLDEEIEIDEIRIPGVRRGALIGAVAVARGAKRQDLPIFFFGARQKIDEWIRGASQRPDAVGRREARDVQENPARASRADDLIIIIFQNFSSSPFVSKNALPLEEGACGIVSSLIVDA